MTIFISYSRRDDELAADLCRRLQAAGHEVWQDQTGIPGGAEWRQSIERAIRVADAFVLLLSPSVTRAPKYPRQELNLASKHDKLIIPVYARPVRALPEGFELTLGGIEHVELFPSFDDGMTRLLTVLGPTDTGPAVGGERVRLRDWARGRVDGAKAGAHHLRMEARQRELGKKALKTGGALAAGALAVAAAAARQSAKRESAEAAGAMGRYRDKVDVLLEDFSREFARVGQSPMSTDQYRREFPPKLQRLLGELSATEPPKAELLEAHGRLVRNLEETLRAFGEALNLIDHGDEEAAKRELERMVETFFKSFQAYASVLEGTA